MLNTSEYYHYCNDSNGAGSNACVNQHFTGDSAIGKWRFVVADTCNTNDQLRACYANVGGAVTCTVATYSSNTSYGSWATGGGFKWIGTGRPYF
jgi:hypothetical protein